MFIKSSFIFLRNYSQKILTLKKLRTEIDFVLNKNFCTSKKTVMPFKLADIGEGIREVIIKAWFVEVNQLIKQFDEVCEVESDKASVSITSRYDGVVRKLYYSVGDVALVGSTLLDIELEDEQTIEEEVVAVDLSGVPSGVDEKKIAEDLSGVDEKKIQEDIKTTEDKFLEPKWDKSLATPAVRRLAMENNVDIKKIKGSGKDGRVMKEDILLYLKKPDEILENENSFQLTGYRKVMVRTMTESNQIPTLVLSDEFDISKLNNLKIELREIFLKENNMKLTLLPFFVKAVSLSLLEYKILNSYMDKNCEKIIYNKSHNIGIAIDTKLGLVVPNIKSVENLSIKEITKILDKLQKSANDGTLSIQDVSNGTFTISNIGSIAGTTVKPLILPPQVAIGGFGKFQNLPRFDHLGNVKSSIIIHVSWAADHRIIDGGIIARFSNSVKKYLENPSLFIADL